jgi:hypothetical protein
MHACIFFVISFLVAFNALIIEDVKVCHPVCDRLMKENCQSVCTRQSIEIPDKLTNCVKQLPFKYNNGKNIAFFTKKGQIIKKAAYVDCEANKKDYHFSYDGKKFDVTFKNHDVTVDVTLPSGKVLSNSFNIYSLLNDGQKFVREYYIIIIIIICLIFFLLLIICLSVFSSCFRMKLADGLKCFLNIPIEALRAIFEGIFKRQATDKSAENEKSTYKKVEKSSNNTAAPPLPISITEFNETIDQAVQKYIPRVKSSNNPTAPQLPISITEFNETIDQAVQKYIPRVSNEPPSYSYLQPRQYLPPRHQAIQYETSLSKTKMTKISGRDKKNKNKDDILCGICDRYFAPCAIANHRNSHK